METALLVARLILALIFAVAGVAKLADRPGSRRATIDFGVPASLAAPLGVLLPLCELAVAAALVPTLTAWWGAVGALALLLLFVAGIGANLIRGRKPDCHCFGQLHSAPAGWSTFARNGLLAAVAGLVVWQGREDAGSSVVGWLGALSTAQLAGLVAGLILLGLAAIQWWFLVHLLRQNGRLLMCLEALEERLAVGDGAAPSRNDVPPQSAAGLPVGSPAPAFELSGLHGETVTQEALRAPGKPVMLLFTDPDCGPCTALLPEIGRWQREHAEKLTISPISRGSPGENRAGSSEHGLAGVLLQDDREVSEAYKAYGTPSAVLVRPDGAIGSLVAGGAEAIRRLVTQAVGAPARLPARPASRGGPCPNCGKVHPANGHANGRAAQAVPAGPKAGEPAPEVKLLDLSGESLELADFRGRETLVLFWNPGCGFCQRMLGDLKEWEADPPEGSPELLVVSAGTEEANEAMGLSSPVVLDQDFSTGRAFGASGTPSAVLVDPEGKIASELAVGASAILELVSAGQARP